jgi:hypothetical protein
LEEKYLREKSIFDFAFLAVHSRQFISRVFTFHPQLSLLLCLSTICSPSFVNNFPYQQQRQSRQQTKLAMDHAVKASRSHPWNKLRFENDELEELYQRYTHKIQWISVFGVVTLVVMLTGIMAILSLAYNQAATIHVSRCPCLFSCSLSGNGTVKV